MSFVIEIEKKGPKVPIFRKLDNTLAVFVLSKPPKKGRSVVTYKSNYAF